MKAIESIYVYRTTLAHKENPIRHITQYWAFDGETLLAENDPHLDGRLRAEASLQETLRSLRRAVGAALDHTGVDLDVCRGEQEPDVAYRTRVQEAMLKIATNVWLAELLRGV